MGEFKITGKVAVILSMVMNTSKIVLTVVHNPAVLCVKFDSLRVAAPKDKETPHKILQGRNMGKLGQFLVIF